VNLGALHLLRPAALLLLLALPLFWLRWRARRASAGAWREAVDAHLLPHLLERGEAGSARSALALAALLWTLAALALAGPAWDREPMPLFRNQAARVLALELAPSMLAQDERPDRLARARYKLDDILDRSRDLQTALIGYAGEAFIAAPLTDDVGTVRNLVEALDPSTMPVPGNATSKAIDAGVALIEQAGLHRGEIVLLADSADAGAAAAARHALDHGVRVSVLGIGSAGGAPVALAQGGFLKDAAGNVVLARLDESALRGVAEAGGGRYAALTPDAADLDALLGVSSPADAAGAMPEDAAGSRWRDRGPWFALLLLPLALAGFRRGWLLVLACSIAWPAAPARAMSLADFWQRPDQQAAAALARGDAKRAADVAATPAWRGSAAYRAGDYARALEAYAQAHDADGAYDRGNALAKLGRYQDAIAAYDEALRLAPSMDDARANRKAVEDFLARQKEKPSPQQGDKGDAQDRKKQDGQSQDPPGSQQQPGTTGDPSQGAGQAPRPDPDAQGDRDQPPPADAKGNAAQQPSGKPDGQSASQAPDAAQQQALSQSIDRALAKDPKRPDARAPTDAKAVREEDDATSEQRQALENLLQRVPDDPGGLLRRKFQLEYQRRQQQGGEGR
jgi:Ca-activated chloride channel homolog